MADELDPTRTTTKQNEAEREWRVRWSLAKKRVIEYIEALPRTQNEPNIIVKLLSNAPKKYTFDVSAEQLTIMQADIIEIMTATVGGDWLFAEYVGTAYAQGTAQAKATLKPQLSILGVQETPVPLNAIGEYQHRMNLLQARVFEEVKWVAEEHAQLLGKTLARAVLRGDGAIETGKTIAELFDVKEYVGERLARTEITMALKRARLDEGEAQAERHGLEIKFMHTSAFSPTSRYEHMQRHSLIFTGEEIRDWYSRDGNAINCRCSVSECIIDKDGEPLAKGLITRAEKIKQKYADRIEEAKK